MAGLFSAAYVHHDRTRIYGACTAAQPNKLSCTQFLPYTTGYMEGIRQPKGGLGGGKEVEKGVKHGEDSKTIRLHRPQDRAGHLVKDLVLDEVSVATYANMMCLTRRSWPRPISGTYIRVQWGPVWRLYEGAEEGSVYLQQYKLSQGASHGKFAVCLCVTSDNTVIPDPAFKLQIDMRSVTAPESIRNTIDVEGFDKQWKLRFETSGDPVA